MKRIGLLMFFTLITLSITLTDCRKKDPIDPCEGVECRPDQKCVNGKCVPIRRG